MPSCKKLIYLKMNAFPYGRRFFYLKFAKIKYCCIFATTITEGDNPGYGKRSGSSAG